MLIAALLDLIKLKTTFVPAIKIVLHAQALIITTVLVVRVERKRTGLVF